MNHAMIGTAAATLLALSGTAFAQNALEGTLQKIAETGQVVVSYRDAAIPFSYISDDQKPVGYALEICLKVVEEIKAELGKPETETVFQMVAGANRIPLLLNGTIDLECGTTTNNVERQAQVAFSNTYFVSEQRILIKKDSGIATIADLAGKTVASNSGSTGLRLLVEMNQQQDLGMTTVPGRDLAETFLLLESDRAAAVVQDDILLTGMVARSRDPEGYALIGDALALEPYSVMIRRDDPQFKAVVDRAVAKLLESGEIGELYNKWFVQPIPPQDINLNFPVSPATQKAWDNPTDSADPASYQ